VRTLYWNHAMLDCWDRSENEYRKNVHGNNGCCAPIFLLSWPFFPTRSKWTLFPSGRFFHLWTFFPWTYFPSTFFPNTVKTLLKPPLSAQRPKDGDTAGNVCRIAVALKDGFPMVDDNGRNSSVELCVFAGPQGALSAPITLHYTLYFLLHFADTR